MLAIHKNVFNKAYEAIADADYSELLALKQCDGVQLCTGATKKLHQITHFVRGRHYVFFGLS